MLMGLRREGGAGCCPCLLRKLWMEPRFECPLGDDPRSTGGSGATAPACTSWSTASGVGRHDSARGEPCCSYCGWCGERGEEAAARAACWCAVGRGPGARGGLCACSGLSSGLWAVAACTAAKAMEGVRLDTGNTCEERFRASSCSWKAELPRCDICWCWGGCWCEGSRRRLVRWLGGSLMPGGAPLASDTSESRSRSVPMACARSLDLSTLTLCSA